MNVPEMTIGGEKPVDTTELDNLRRENNELFARCNVYEEQLRAAREDDEKAYMRGRIEGLEFSIRCNGVSGNEVSKA